LQSSFRPMNQRVQKAIAAERSGASKLSYPMTARKSL
jgi:hypothetical protein